MPGAAPCSHPLRPSVSPQAAPYLRLLASTGDRGLAPCYAPPLPQEWRGVTVSAPNGISPIGEHYLASRLSLSNT